MDPGSKNSSKVATAQLFRVGILVAFGGFFVTSTTAWCYGVSVEVATFFAAWSICSSFQRLFQAGQLAEISLPRYLKEKEESGLSYALDRYSLLTNWMTIASIILSVVLALIAPSLSELLLPGFDQSQTKKAVELFRGLMPVIPAIVYGGFLQSLGNAEKQYGRFELWLFFGQIAAAVSVLTLHNSLGVWALVWSAWLTQLVALIGRLFYLNKVGCRPSRCLWIKGYSPRQLFSELGLTSTYVGVTQLYLLSLNAALTFLPPGLFAVFKYTELLFDRTSSLVLRPVSTVFFTDISLEASRGKSGLPKLITNTLAHFADYWGLYFCLIGACATPLISLAWGNSKFDWASVCLTSEFLTVLAGVSLFRAMGLVFRKYTIAVGSAHWQYTGYIFVQLMMALITLPIVKVFGFWGGASLLCINILMFGLSDLLVAMTTKIKPLILIPYGVFIKTFLISLITIVIGKSLGDMVYAQTLIPLSNHRIADLMALIVGGSVVLIMLEVGGRAIGLGGIKVLFKKS
jgi:peptidoglycan biosynthesis protein MviN/MurJ (putative lipid II flippase)